jgi:tetratricopeptide (TPR) repeat protein
MDLPHGSASVQPVGAAQGGPAAFTLSLRGTMRLTASDGRAILPGGLRGRAVLALLATAPGLRRPRRFVASLLWSTIPLRQALARLRDVMHDLRRSLEAAGCDALRADAHAIWLRPDALAVEPPDADPSAPLLPELLGIDPQFDLWLAAARGRDPVREPPAAPRATESAKVGGSSGSQVRLRVLRIASLAGAAVPHLDTALTDAVVAALSPIRAIAVLAESSPTSAAANADYQLAGHGLLAAGTLQATFRLSELRDGQILWAGLIAPQDMAQPGPAMLEIAAMVSARVEHEVLLHRAERAIRMPGPGSPTDQVLRAITDLQRLERDRFLRAGRLLASAARADPDLAFGKAWLAFWHVLAVGQGWAENEREALAQAGEAAEQAILLDPRDALALAIAGHVRSYLHRRVAEGLALCRRALGVNPNLPAAWGFAGMSLAYAGELDAAHTHLRRAIALLPEAPHAFFNEAGLATVQMLRGDFESATTIGRSVLQLHPRFTAALRAQIAALGHLGLAEEAKPLIRSLLSLDPGFTLARFRATAPYRVREQLEHFLRGLRLAGVS